MMRPKAVGVGRCSPASLRRRRERHASFPAPRRRFRRSSARRSRCAPSASTMKMHRRERIDVVEREHFVVLVHLPRRHLAANDPAEDAACHGIHARQSASPASRATVRAAFLVDARRCLRAARARRARRAGAGRAARAAPGSETTDRRIRDDCSLSPSFAASTVSVASSPIFFRIASSPLAASARDVRASAGSRLRAAAIVAASRAQASSRVRSLMRGIAIDVSGILAAPARSSTHALAFESLEEAAVASGVAGDAAELLDFEQDRRPRRSRGGSRCTFCTWPDSSPLCQSLPARARPVDAPRPFRPSAPAPRDSSTRASARGRSPPPARSPAPGRRRSS